MPDLYSVSIDSEGIEDEGSLSSEAVVGNCALVEALIWFGRIWHWQPSEVLRMPIRRREMMLQKLNSHLKKVPLTGL